MGTHRAGSRRRIATVSAGVLTSGALLLAGPAATALAAPPSTNPNGPSVDNNPVSNLGKFISNVQQQVGTAGTNAISQTGTAIGNGQQQLGRAGNDALRQIGTAGNNAIAQIGTAGNNAIRVIFRAQTNTGGPCTIGTAGCSGQPGGGGDTGG